MEGEPLSDDCLKMFNDGVDVAICRVDDERVVGRPKGGDGAVGVALVTGGLFGEQSLEGNMTALCGEFLLPPVGTDFGVGGEEELAIGLWEGDGSLVAALADNIAAACHAALCGDQGGANVRVPRDERGGFGRLRGAERVGHVPTVGERAAFIKGDVERFGQFSDGRLVLRVDLLREACGGDGAVHGSRVEVIEPQPRGQPAGGRAFAGSSGAVDGNNHRGGRLVVGSESGTNLLATSGLSKSSLRVTSQSRER